VSPELKEKIQEILLKLLPPTDRQRWDRMVGQWNTSARGTAHFSARVLHARVEEEENPYHLLLTFRCSSTYSDYKDKYYDERAAIVSVEPDRVAFFTVPVGGNAEDTARLAHIELDQMIQLPGVTGLSLRVYCSNDHPGAALARHKEERLVYYIFEDAGLRGVANILRRSESDEPDGNGAKVTTIYEAMIEQTKDSSGNLSGLTSRYTVRQNGRTVESEVLKYSWNAEKGSFQ